MITKRAAVLGRCMGVRRAVDLALATLSAESGPGGKARTVFSLGPLIHNPRTVAELEAAGVSPIEESGENFVGPRGEKISLSGALVVIRAHGVPPRLRERIEAAGAILIDATCPRVLASQRRARDYAAKGWPVVIAGDRDHGEVTGIAGFAPGAFIVGCPEEAAEAAKSIPPGPLALIAQTTIKEEEYTAIRKVLGEAFPLLETVDSICPATEERIAALEELAESCEALVIVGGRNSANTKRLLATAQASGRPSWLVEGPDELPPEIWGYSSVGISAGASTPDEAIAEVEAALRGSR